MPPTNSTDTINERLRNADASGFLNLILFLWKVSKINSKFCEDYRAAVGGEATMLLVSVSHQHCPTYYLPFIEQPLAEKQRCYWCLSPINTVLPSTFLL